MQLTIPNPKNPKWVFLVLLSFVSLSLSDPETTEAGVFCGSSKLGTRQNFIPNFITAMERVSQRVNDTQWAARSVILRDPKVFTYAQCYGFLSNEECRACYGNSRAKLPKCLPANSGRIYLDGCYLRYDNYSFYGEAIDRDRDTVKCGKPNDTSTDKYMGKEFSRRIDKVIDDVTNAALRNMGFAVAGEEGGVEAVYAMAQCWMTLDHDGCKLCLSNAELKVKSCAPALEGRVMNAGCYLRYSTENFFGNSTLSPKESQPYSNRIVSVSILCAITLTIVALFGAVLGYKRISEMKTEQSTLAEVSISVHNCNLNFMYEVLERATDGFAGSRKLGQGGNGSVFMGTLPDGAVVAVKRLFFNTRQWVDEFFNEVNLVSGIQHKNLVRLLGCSIEGPECLLVYEYVPNKSLDQALFGKNTVLFLTWKNRFDIISGIADGLAYLHGGWGEKIIHRDIKTSNILLDENLTPKIADFGLARCVASNRSHVSTVVAGTLGYMAPEYLVRGQLTEKADVYAFGVLVMEVVCGKKNTVFTQGSSSILHSVWKHYRAGNITKSVDPTLEGAYPVSKAANVLQIGLLCTQASVALRPSMSEVVQMLSDEEGVIPYPKQPPFLNASVLSVDDCVTTSSSDSETTVERFFSCKYNPSNQQRADEVDIFFSAESTSPSKS